MLDEAAKDLYGLFSRRFVFNALLPTSIFLSLTVGFGLLMFLSGAEITDRWLSTPILSQILVVLAYAAANLFLSAIVASQWRGIVRLFEGYPLNHMARLFNRPSRGIERHSIGVKWHQDRASETVDPSSRHSDPERAYSRYPGDDHWAELLPSRLGNILLAGERYSFERYGADAILFWPRLYPLLPSRFKTDYERFLINHEFPLVAAFEAFLATIACSAVAFVAGGPWWLFAAVFGLGGLTSYLFYVSSLSSAEELAEQQRTAFDLFRSELIAAWPLAEDIRDEKVAFEQIEGFVVAGHPPSWTEPPGLATKRAGTISIKLTPPPGQ